MLLHATLAAVHESYMLASVLRVREHLPCSQPPHYPKVGSSRIREVIYLHALNKWPGRRHRRAYRRTHTRSPHIQIHIQIRIHTHTLIAVDKNTFICYDLKSARNLSSLVGTGTEQTKTDAKHIFTEAALKTTCIDPKGESY